MMNCKQATQLLSEKLDRSLGKKEKIALYFHTTMCGSCKNFSNQMEELRNISKIYTSGKTNLKK